MPVRAQLRHIKYAVVRTDEQIEGIADHVPDIVYSQARTLLLLSSAESSRRYRRLAAVMAIALPSPAVSIATPMDIGAWIKKPPSVWQRTAINPRLVTPPATIARAPHVHPHSDRRLSSRSRRSPEISPNPSKAISCLSWGCLPDRAGRRNRSGLWLGNRSFIINSALSMTDRVGY